MDKQTQFEATIKAVLALMGLQEDASYDSSRKHVSVLLEHSTLNEKNLPLFVNDFNFIFQLLAKKHDVPSVFVDINNYQKKREGLILEIARAAARKAIATKTEVVLPAMNSYERRLVHVELAAHPEVKTESIGGEKKRCVVVKIVEEEKKNPD